MDIAYAVGEHRIKEKWEVQRQGKLIVHIYNAQKELLIFYKKGSYSIFEQKLDWKVASDLFNVNQTLLLAERPPSNLIRQCN